MRVQPPPTVVLRGSPEKFEVPSGRDVDAATLANMAGVAIPQDDANTVVEIPDTTLPTLLSAAKRGATGDADAHHDLVFRDGERPLVGAARPRALSNPLSPSTPAGVAAYSRFAAAAAKHYQGRDVIWEIYNEPLNFWAAPTGQMPVPPAGWVHGGIVHIATCSPLESSVH